MVGYIYMTTNLINGHKYIGKRKKDYFDTKYKGSGKILQQAIKKYGWDNFKCELLEECNSVEDLNDMEKYYIKLYNAVSSPEFYNLAIGGEGCGLPGKVLTQEHKNKISIANTGKIRTQEFKDNLSVITKSRNLAFTYRNKISESLKGHNVSSDTREKISNSQKGRVAWNKGKSMSEEQKAKISQTKLSQKRESWNKGLTKETDERVATYGRTKHLNSKLK